MIHTLTGLSSMATRALLAELLDDYHQATGVAVQLRSIGGVDAARTVRGGAKLDVVVLVSSVMKALEAEGHLVDGSCVDLARSEMAMAVPDGAPQPPLGDAVSVRAAILHARAVGYSTGPSGDHLLKLIAGWDIADHVAGKMVRAPAGTPVAALLASGEVDLGVQQLSELLGAPGVQVVGRLPAAIQTITTFTAAVARVSDHPDEAHALVARLASPRTADVKRRHGMEPAA